ncbi:MAG: hypothetical protein CL583_10540 [Alteromonadaceae bacterium]|nr:hypothetical protein [Alteromonadaceae bacterium]
MNVLQNFYQLSFLYSNDSFSLSFIPLLLHFQMQLPNALNKLITMMNVTIPYWPHHTEFNARIRAVCSTSNIAILGYYYQKSRLWH